MLRKGTANLLVLGPPHSESRPSSGPACRRHTHSTFPRKRSRNHHLFRNQLRWGSDCKFYPRRWQHRCLYQCMKPSLLASMHSLTLYLTPSLTPLSILASTKDSTKGLTPDSTLLSVLASMNADRTDLPPHLTLILTPLSVLAPMSDSTPHSTPK